MTRTMTLHVPSNLYKYISLLSLGKQQREMTKLNVFLRTYTAMANCPNFSCLPLKLNAVITLLAGAVFYTDRRTEQIYTAATFEGKI